MYYDDELEKAAFEIPDLQVSDLQREGPYFLPKDSLQNKPKYVQSQTKVKTFYKFRASVKYFLAAYKRNAKIVTARFWDLWKIKAFTEEVERKDFIFMEKFRNVFRVFYAKRRKGLAKSLFHWKLISFDSKNRKSFSDQLKLMDKEELKLKQDSLQIKEEIQSLEEKLKSKKFMRTEVGLSKGSTIEGLLKLRRENSLLSSKLEQTSKVFSSYLHQIQGLLQRC
jgi:hypothetical protein